MKKEKIHATVRKNKANNHKYVTIPRESKIKEGQKVIVEEE